jgi:hypothetical protein
MAFTFFSQLLPFTDALLADIPSELDLGNLSFCSSDTDIDEVSPRAEFCFIESTLQLGMGRHCKACILLFYLPGNGIPLMISILQNSSSISQSAFLHQN